MTTETIPVQVILEPVPGSSLVDILKILQQQSIWQPFDARAMAFVARFSQMLLLAPGVRQFPELAALGHWFRGAQLQKLAQQYRCDSSIDSDFIQRGRGLAFHVAPSNVDSVFMYSWLLSLLAGNVNLVRVSQKTSAGQDFLIAVLKQALGEAVGEPIRNRIVLLTYTHDVLTTQQISEACMIRVVWGGDATVQVVRAIPLRPTAMEICFPDRFSACVLQAQAVEQADDIVLARLVADFYNDAFWFAQQACSSPRLLAWVGDERTIDVASARFWCALQDELLRRPTQNSDAMLMARISACFAYAAEELAHPVGLLSAHPLRLQMEAPLSVRAKRLHCGYGLFLELSLSTLTDLVAHLTDKEQTLAVYGFERQELAQLLDALPARAVDRITKVGQAQAFTPTWDGTDLITVFSRRLLLPEAI